MKQNRATKLIIRKIYPIAFENTYSQKLDKVESGMGFSNNTRKLHHLNSNEKVKDNLESLGPFTEQDTAPDKKKNEKNKGNKSWKRKRKRNKWKEKWAEGQNGRRGGKKEGQKRKR